MASVLGKDGESYDSMLRRFKRSVDKAGVLAEAKRRQCHETGAAKRKRLKAAAVKRERKNMYRDRFASADSRKRVH